jgi:hypothetical protein
LGLYAFVIWGWVCPFLVFFASGSMHDGMAVFFFPFLLYSSLVGSERVLQERRDETGEGKKNKSGKEGLCVR